MATAPELVFDNRLQVGAPRQRSPTSQPYGHQQWEGVVIQDSPVQTDIPRPRRQRMCGLRLVTFLLLAVLILVILGAAIGGGVGGAIAVNNAKK